MFEQPYFLIEKMSRWGREFVIPWAPRVNCVYLIKSFDKFYSYTSISIRFINLINIDINISYPQKHTLQKKTENNILLSTTSYSTLRRTTQAPLHKSSLRRPKIKTSQHSPTWSFWEDESLEYNSHTIQSYSLLEYSWSCWSSKIFGSRESNEAWQWQVAQSRISRLSISLHQPYSNILFRWIIT